MCFKKKTDGTLIVNLSGEEVPLQLNLDVGITELLTKKYLCLEIVPKDIPTEISYTSEEELIQNN